MLSEPYRRVSKDLPNLAFKAAHTGLPRVAANDGDESLIVDLDLIGLQPVGSDLPADKLAASDLELLAFRIARQADDLHSVAQRAQNRIEHIGGGNEDDAA